MQGQGPGAPTWSVAIYWMHRLWSILGSTGQGQPPVGFFPGATLHELYNHLRWLLLVLGLDNPRQSQAVNLG